MDKTHFASYSEVIDSIPVLHMSGEIDLYTAPMFKDAITSPITQGYIHIVVDMKDVAFMDSSGFGALLSASKPLRSVSGSINLASCNDAITRMLEITRLNAIIPVHKSPEEAIAHVASLQPQLVTT
jgi:anti-sigma B factor antagonist